MYTEFFQIKKRPFAATPDPECCYMADPTVTVPLTEIIRCLEGNLGIALLTGAAGTGKSLLAQHLANELEDRLQIAYVRSCQFVTRRSLLQAILYELQQPFVGKSDVELHLELHSCLLGSLQEFGGTLLILDEAHLLSEQLLEEVRTLADLSQGGVPLLQILLVGQLPLEERLAQPGTEAFNHRIGVQASLQPFSREEALGYIAYRCLAAGGEMQRLFTEEAARRIALASDGLPRQINHLCDHALMLAYVMQQRQVDLTIVEQALEDLQRLPLHWNPTAMPAQPLEKLAKEVVDVQFEEPRQSESKSMESEKSFNWERILKQEEFDIEATDDSLDEAVFEVGAEWDSSAQPETAESAPEVMEIEIVPPSVPTVAPSVPQAAEVPVVNTVRTTRQMVMEPAEERVIDRYAALDAGRKPEVVHVSPPIAPALISQPVSEQKAAEKSESAPTKIPHPILRGPVSSAFFEHASMVPPGANLEITDPLQYLDEIVVPMLNRAQDVDLPTRSELDRRLEEFISAQKSTETHRRLSDDLDVEERLGEDVLELCLETEQQIHGQEFDQLDDQSGTPEVGLFATSTEEVPGDATFSNLIARSDLSHPAVPTPNYKTVFSELRRKLKKQRLQSP